MTNNEKALQMLATGEKRSLAELELSPDSVDDFTAWLDQLSIDFEFEAGSLVIPVRVDLLDEKKIRSEMSEQALASLDQIEVHLTIDSTNSYLMNMPDIQRQSVLCLAELQTAGRGRRGRTWVSPFGTNLYMSLHWSLPSGQSLEGLSLAVGVGIAKALEESGVLGVKLKWPNDLMLEGAKLGGILIEVKPPSQQLVELVIGIGINFKMPEQSAGLIDQAWQDLSGQVKFGSRNEITGKVVNSVIQLLHEYSQSGFSAFRDAWISLDAYHGKPITVLHGDRQTTGIEQGVDLNGALMVETDYGLETFHGGEVSMRSGDGS